jgi:hypothetical protein
MLKRGFALAAALGVVIWALLDQWNRYTGAPGGPTFDIATPYPIAALKLRILDQSLCRR